MFGFIFFSFLRTIGDGLITDTSLINHWENSLIFAKEISIYCILFAMVALGLQTNLKNMVKLGEKPLLIGLAATHSVGIVSVVYIK